MLTCISCHEQVNELRTQNEYQLRLKDMAQNEKIREMNDKFTAELEGSKLKLEAFVQVLNQLQTGCQDATPAMLPMSGHCA